MRIEVISSTDENLRYLKCAPFFIDFWVFFGSQLNVTFVPKIYVVADKLPELLLPYESFCELVPSNHLSTAFVAQNIRTLAAAASNADFAITSDIDMLPLNLRPMLVGLKKAQITPGAFVVIRDVLPPGQFAICYNLATPAVWDKVIDAGVGAGTIGVRLATVFDRYCENGEYSGIHGGAGWTTDQQFLYHSATSAENIQLVKLKDFETGHSRLDRARFRGIFIWLTLGRAAKGRYTDFHVPKMQGLNVLYIKTLYYLLKRNQQNE